MNVAKRYCASCKKQTVTSILSNDERRCVDCGSLKEKIDEDLETMRSRVFIFTSIGLVTGCALLVIAIIKIVA